MWDVRCGIWDVEEISEQLAAGSWQQKVGVVIAAVYLETLILKSEIENPKSERLYSLA